MAITPGKEATAIKPTPPADEEEEAETEPEGHTLVFSLPTLQPIAAGSVPRVLGEIDAAQQRNQTIELYTFLRSSDPTLACLNKSNKCYVGVVNVPKTKHVRVVYGFGFGTNPIG